MLYSKFDARKTAVVYPNTERRGVARISGMGVFGYSLHVHFKLARACKPRPINENFLN